MRERRTGHVSPAGEVVGDARPPALRLLGPAGGQERPGPGDDERDQQRPLAGRQREVQALLAPSDGIAGVTDLQVDFGKGPERRHDELHLADPTPGGQRLLEPATCLIRAAATEGDETDDVERPDRAAPATAIDELVAGALVRRIPPTGAPIEERGRRGHHLAAVRLLDRVGVLEPFPERQLRGSRVHDPRGHDREVAIARHADRLEPGFACLARGAHAVGEALLVAAVDDVDPGQGQVGLQDRLTVADRFGQLSRRLGIRTGRRELRGE